MIHKKKLYINEGWDVSMTGQIILAANERHGELSGDQQFSLL